MRKERERKKRKTVGDVQKKERVREGEVGVRNKYKSGGEGVVAIESSGPKELTLDELMEEKITARDTSSI